MSIYYQEPAWKTHQWTKSEGVRSGHRKFHFKQIARAVKFTSKLFGRALSKRIKATILYATETGKSEQYAKELGNVLGHAFNAQVRFITLVPIYGWIEVSEEFGCSQIRWLLTPLTRKMQLIYVFSHFRLHLQNLKQLNTTAYLVPLIMRILKELANPKTNSICLPFI